MNDKRYRWILYSIAITIVLTIIVQLYWNYKNYLLNKQNFINSVQISLDNALENYYADLAEANQLTFVDLDKDSLTVNHEKHSIISDSIFKDIKLKYKGGAAKDISGFTQIQSNDSGFTFSKSNNKFTKIKVVRGKKASDSLKLLKGITSIFISIRDDSLNFSKLNPLLIKELERKKINMPFALKHSKNDSLFNSFNDSIIKKGFLKTTSKTKFLKENEALELIYPNATLTILKLGLSGILLSLLLSIVIISSLFYLLKIIKHQKQLSEVKNDLISNITHEFKTPIATIGVALESIQDFNVIDNKEKTKSYLKISSNQLSKLNLMVEKLLETANLDSNSLELNKEEANIIKLVETLTEKHKFQLENKIINFNASADTILAKIDVFHFENAINNILDNAIKYGGNAISVNLKQENNKLNISISDNGNNLTKANKERIFEKFYRIPKGNTHDIKGFGIGLYYAKTIIEKHGGTINLDLSNKLTSFKISLPNE